MMVVYSILVLVIFAMEIVAGAYAYTKRDKVEQRLTDGIQKAVETNYGEAGTASDGMTKAIDWLQENVKCCGSTGPGDWTTSQWYRKRSANDTAEVPKTCCKTQSTGCNVNTASKDTIYKAGCIGEGKKFAKDNLWLIGGVGVGIAVVELLGIGFAMCLCCAFKKEEDEVV